MYNFSMGWREEDLGKSLRHICEVNEGVYVPVGEERPGV
jgi:hypothetical protein